MLNHANSIQFLSKTHLNKITPDKEVKDRIKLAQNRINQTLDGIILPGNFQGFIKSNGVGSSEDGL